MNIYDFVYRRCGLFAAPGLGVVMSEETKKLEKQIEGAKALGCVEAVRYLQGKLDVMKAKVTVVIESTCIDCGWKGAESEHHFLDGWHVCPECHQAEFLVSGEELEELKDYPF